MIACRALCAVAVVVAVAVIMPMPMLVVVVVLLLNLMRAVPVEKSGNRHAVRSAQGQWWWSAAPCWLALGMPVEQAGDIMLHDAR